MKKKKKIQIAQLPWKPKADNTNKRHVFLKVRWKPWQNTSLGGRRGTRILAVLLRGSYDINSSTRHVCKVTEHKVKNN